VELRRSGREFVIPPGKSILEVLRDAGMDLSYSCEQGICGACETRVISGVPVHRDSVLTPAERAANTTVMICCAGSKSERLVLDLGGGASAPLTPKFACGRGAGCANFVFGALGGLKARRPPDIARVGLCQRRDQRRRYGTLAARQGHSRLIGRVAPER